MTQALTYAVAGGPPDDWHDLKVFDLDTGKEIKDVFEVDTVNGWLQRYLRGADGRFYVWEGSEEIATEILDGRFEIRRPA